MNNPLIFTDPSGYMPNWVQDEYDHYYRNGGGSSSGYNYFGWISKWGHSSGASHGWSYNIHRANHWSYDPASSSYSNSFTGESMSATPTATDQVISDAGGIMYGIYEIAYSLDGGNNFTRTGKYRMIKEGVMNSTGMFPTFQDFGLAQDFADDMNNPVSLEEIRHNTQVSDFIKLGLKIKFGLADAVSREFSITSNAGIASSANPLLLLTKYSGLDVGENKLCWSAEAGLGLADVGVFAGNTHYFIVGASPEEISLAQFQGPYFKLNISAGEFFPVGEFGVSISRVNPRTYIIGISRAIGIGGSVTPVSFSTNKGWMYFYNN